MREMIYDPHPAPVPEPLFTMDSVDEMEKSPVYMLEVNGAPETVYHTDVFDYAPVVVDDPAGGIHVRLEIARPFREVTVRPSSRCIVPKVDGQTVTFTFPSLQKVTVELDGDKQSPLFLFCQKRYEKPANATIVFEKGKI